MSGTRSAVRAVALGALLTLAPACGGPGAARPRSAPISLSLPALDGGQLDLATLRGRVVVLHVFTTWSVAAQLDVEQLALADGAPEVVVVGIALDPDGRMLVAPWRAAGEVRYLIVLADDAVRAGVGALGPLPEVPTTLVLDDEGRITARAPGQLRAGELARMIASARR